MIIKICGMRDADNIRQLEKSGIADWMGMVFVPSSPRYVKTVPSYLPSTLWRTGVFVNPSLEDIRNHALLYGLTGIQLHGEETPAFTREVKKATALTILKAFSIASADDLKQTKDYEGVCDYFLFDTKCKEQGGSGKQFDWSVLQYYKGETPFLLSGGIGPDSLNRLRHFRHPLWAGIDLNSRFESAPGLKDIPALIRFCKEFKALYS